MEKCERFYFLNALKDQCLHMQFSSINTFSLVGAIITPIAFGACNALGVGAIGFQIFFLQVFFNYGKKDASLMNQPLQLATYFLKSIENFRVRKLPNKPAVNENLVLLLLPMMVSGCAVGIHSKDYIPTLVSAIITGVSLVLLIFSTNKKQKQFSQIIKAADENQLQALENDFINVGDGIVIDVEQFFQQIQHSMARQSFIKILPQQLLEIDLTIDEHKIKAKDYLNQNQNITKEIHEKMNYRSIPKLKVFLYLVVIILNVLLLFRITEMHICNTDAVQNFLVQVWHRNELQTKFNITLFVIIATITKTSDIILLVQLFVLSYLFGLLLGSVGAAAQIILILSLTKMKRVQSSTAEVAMTLPILMFAVTLTSTIISMSTGLIHDYVGVAAMFLLTVVGQKVFQPLFQKFVKPKFALQVSFYFQCIMLFTFIFFQISRNLGKTLKEQLTPRAVCLE